MSAFDPIAFDPGAFDAGEAQSAPLTIELAGLYKPSGSLSVTLSTAKRLNITLTGRYTPQGNCALGIGYTVELFGAYHPQSLGGRSQPTIEARSGDIEFIYPKLGRY